MKKIIFLLNLVKSYGSALYSRSNVRIPRRRRRDLHATNAMERMVLERRIYSRGLRGSQ